MKAIINNLMVIMDRMEIVQVDRLHGSCRFEQMVEKASITITRGTNVRCLYPVEKTGEILGCLSVSWKLEL